MGKKDAKQEYYQVEEARRKRRTNCATQSEARVVTRRVRSKRVGENEAFLLERFLKTWSWEGKTCCFSYGKYSD